MSGGGGLAARHRPGPRAVPSSRYERAGGYDGIPPEGGPRPPARRAQRGGLPRDAAAHPGGAPIAAGGGDCLMRRLPLAAVRVLELGAPPAGAHCGVEGLPDHKKERLRLADEASRPARPDIIVASVGGPEGETGISAADV